MKVSFSVTYEFPERQPVTFKGTLEASGEHVVARRAIKEAKKALRPVGWSSVVCLVSREADSGE